MELKAAMAPKPTRSEQTPPLLHPTPQHNYLPKEGKAEVQSGSRTLHIPPPNSHPPPTPCLDPWSSGPLQARYSHPMQEVGEFAEKLNGPREEVYACCHVGVPQWKLQLTAQSPHSRTQGGKVQQSESPAVKHILNQLFLRCKV